MSRTPPSTTWPLIWRYVVGQSLALAVLPAVWAAILSSARADDPRGIRGISDVIYDAWSSLGYWVIVAVVAVIILTIQALSLASVWRPLPRLKRPPLLWLSAAVVGLVAIPLVFVSLLIILTIIGRLGVSLGSVNPSPTLQAAIPWILGAIPLVAWGCGIMVARWRLSRRLARGASHEEALTGLGRDLLQVVGALTLAAAAVWLHARVTTSIWGGSDIQALTICALMIITVLGPVVIAPRIGRGRSEWYASHCDRCGYEKGRPGEASRAIERCPECGLEWTPAQQSAP
ncbi:MAG: hypothetical protein K2Q20_10625 [Phycisphaerales bacterium]|nr:hypothetical protein [Phycisphaerales bacterium]